MRGYPIRLVLSLGALLLPPTLAAKAKPEELLQLTDDTLEAALAVHPLMLVNTCADTYAPGPPYRTSGYTCQSAAYQRHRAAFTRAPRSPAAAGVPYALRFRGTTGQRGRAGLRPVQPGEQEDARGGQGTARQGSGRHARAAHHHNAGESQPSP